MCFTKLYDFICRPDIRGRGSVGKSLGICCGKVVLFGFGGIVFAVGLALGILWPFMFHSLLSKVRLFFKYTTPFVVVIVFVNLL